MDLDEASRVAAARRLVPRVPGNATLDRLTGLAARLLGTGSAQVSLLTDHQTVVGGAGLGAIAVGAGATPLEDSLCTVTAASGEPLVVSDATGDVRVVDLPPVRLGAIRSYLGVPLEDGHGNVVGALCAYDPAPREWSTDEVNVLEQLAYAATAELERAAVAAERDGMALRLEVAMESGGIGSWEWDPSTRELHGDRQLLEMFGYAEHELVTRLESYVDRMHPDDGERVSAALEHVAGTGLFTEEFRVVAADGSVRWLAARGRPLPDATGTTARMVGAAYDTTVQHAAEEQATTASALAALLAEASDRLADSLEAQDAVRSLARLVVPRLGDWSIVSLVGKDGRLEDVESWHRDPAMRPVLARFAAHRLEGRKEPAGSLLSLTSGQPFILDEDAAAYARRTLRDPDALETLEQLALESVVVLPMLDGNTVIGLITLARGPRRPPLSPAELATATDLSRRASTALANTRSFGQEREMSAQLQRSMLTDPVQPEHMEVVVRYTSASQAAQVGGDWYDAFQQEGGATMLVVGDVVGHDTASAAAMGQMRSLLRGIAVANGGGPAQVLSDLDRVLPTLRLWTNATAVVARVQHEVGDEERGSTRLVWSNAGHPPPVLVDPAGNVSLLEGHDVLLGIAPDLPRHDQTATLEHGSALLMYTDGLFERRGEDLDVSLQRLKERVSELAELPLDALVDALLESMLPTEPEDDVAVLAVRLLRTTQLE